MKTCRKCYEDKAEQDFAPNPKCRGGRGHVCLVCYREQKRSLRRDVNLDTLRSLLSYNPQTGDFLWLSGQRRGRLAGTISDEGYRVIRILSKFHKAHRLAWYMHYGKWPDGLLDHANCDRGDNRISNLRPCTKSQNTANSRVRKDSRSGLKGVCYCARQRKWKARISIQGRLTLLGTFDSAALAHAAYVAEAKQVFGEYARAA